ncbi:hypothetical protein [Methylorubrum sp. SB2]|uniref:hypothetical protein n=1 Tax=Methylorubrum subtropicum TaxID=3138812 RepID=UPI00313C4851
MRTDARLPPLAGALLLASTSPALAQGHDTPNAPEAGPASLGAESHGGERPAAPGGRATGAKPADAPPQGSNGSDADRKGPEPKR